MMPYHFCDEELTDEFHAERWSCCCWDENGATEPTLLVRKMQRCGCFVPVIVVRRTLLFGVWRPDGLLYMDAILLNRASGGGGFDDAFMDSKVFNLGLTFSYPEKNCSGMKWMGRGPYRVWKNRIPGTNYGVWHKEYNNTITGESTENLVYPEFKGYHANLYWATLQSSTAPFTVYAASDGIFLRVFTPEEPHGRQD